MIMNSSLTGIRDQSQMNHTSSKLLLLHKKIPQMTIWGLNNTGNISIYNQVMDINTI